MPANTTLPGAAPPERLATTRRRGLTVAVDSSSRDDAARATRDRDAASPARRVAVLVCHGMGQQVPFETIDAVATQLATAYTPAAPAPITVDQVATADGTFLPRAEVRLTDVAGRPVTVHVYEAYWAPVTEGRVRLRDTLGLLLDAGRRGVRFAYRDGTFDRWMFGGPRDFAIPARRVLELLLATWVTAVLAAAFAGCAILAAAFAAFGLAMSWPRPDVLAVLASIDLALVLDVVLVAGAAWGLSRLATWRATRGVPMGADAASDPGPPSRARRRVWLAAALGVLALAGGLAAEFGRALTAWALSPGGAPRVSALVLAGLALGAALLAVRWMLVQFLGDVVAYVSAYKVSRFQDVRREIQRIGRVVARQVYGAGYGAGANPPERYEAVCLVGHSLGSVLAYDTLNDAVNRDQHVHGWYPDSPAACYDVAGRTRLLLTFGSPLDKTAFIFRTQQGRKAFDVREALAASVQPLIGDVGYPVRPTRWVNVWSRWDWVSGGLHYYDPPAGERDPRAVLNVEARTSRLPWLAHTGYWRTPLVRGVLGAVLTGRLPRDVNAAAVTDVEQLTALRASLEADGTPASAAGEVSTEGTLEGTVTDVGSGSRRATRPPQPAACAGTHPGAA